MPSSFVGPYQLVLLIAVLVAIIDGALVVERSPGTRKAPAANTANAADGDRVETLPLFGRPPSPQWSGYLNATAGCDTAVNGNDCQLHYWLALAEDEEEDGRGGRGGGIKNNHYNDKKKKPLILWLNGGPGASSVVGMLQELGPLLINATGGLMRNPYCWTRVANILILESPVGVGYSYCARQQPPPQQEVQRPTTTTGKNQSSSSSPSPSPSPSCINTDRFTATAARAALEDFFFYKFPHLFPGNSTDFYLAGESYAGVYIPTLAHEILQFNHYQQQQQQHHRTARDAATGDATRIIPLKGILVGDPCTDNAAQRQSRDPLWYAHKNGLVDDAVYETLTQQCNVSVVVIPDDDNVETGGNDDDRLLLRLDNHMKGILRDDDPTLLAACTLAWRKFLWSSSRGTNGKWVDRYIDHYNLFGLVDPRVQMLTEQYMNRPDVRAALHIPDWLDEWQQHAPLPFDYQKQYAACNNNDIELPSMIDLYQVIVPQLRRTWIFNGDVDPCISYEGTRAAVQRIGFNQVNGGGYRPWFYNETAVAGASSFLNEKVATFGPDLQATTQLGMQWGGHVMDYEHNLTFLTVHGSGHMVPMIRPTAALHLLTIFLQQEPSSSSMLAPLLLPDATLSRISTSDFDDYLDEWINEAKALTV